MNCNHSCFSPTWSNTLSLHYFYFLRKRRSPSQLHLLITTTFHLYSFCPLFSHQYNFITFFQPSTHSLSLSFSLSKPLWADLLVVRKSTQTKVLGQKKKMNVSLTTSSFMEKVVGGLFQKLLVYNILYVS